MFPIVKKRVLNETVTLMEVEAPLVARKAKPGQEPHVFSAFSLDKRSRRCYNNLRFSRKLEIS